MKSEVNKSEVTQLQKKNGNPSRVCTTLTTPFIESKTTGCLLEMLQKIPRSLLSGGEYMQKVSTTTQRNSALSSNPPPMAEVQPIKNKVPKTYARK